MTAIRLAVSGGAGSLYSGAYAFGLAAQDPTPPPSDRPALLTSYVYLEAFMKHRHLYEYRDWVLDSGAFSAHMSGTKIDVAKYCDRCLSLAEAADGPTEVYALDVIGDWRASEVNTREMWRRGVRAIPCYHAGEPWNVLTGLAGEYPKIAVGGIAGSGMRMAQRYAFYDQVFARVWPKKVHGFGVSAPRLLERYPFHSVDATSWEIAPLKWGRWKAYGGAALRLRGSKHPLRVEVEHYLRLERRVRDRWARELALLEEA